MYNRIKSVLATLKSRIFCHVILRSSTCVIKILGVHEKGDSIR